jgi:hypothetical protein
VENKIQNLEDELKVLKNEVQAVLLDIKDFLIVGGGMNMGMSGGSNAGYTTEPSSNPFNLSDGGNPAPQQIIITQSPPVPEPPSQEPPEEEFEDSSETEFGATSEGDAFSFSSDAEASEPDWGNSSFESEARDQGWSERSISAEENQWDDEESITLASKTSKPQTDAECEVDLPLLAIVGPWLSRAVSAVGKEQMSKLIELYDIARSLPPKLKQALLMLLDLHTEDNCTSEVSGEALVREGIPLLIELDSLLLRHRTGTLESAILSLLSERAPSKKKTRSRKG